MKRYKCTHCGKIDNNILRQSDGIDYLEDGRSGDNGYCIKGDHIEMFHHFRFSPIATLKKAKDESKT
jgi:hypothetical protein